MSTPIPDLGQRVEARARDLLAQDAPHGWESHLPGEPASCWFDSARNAAAWVEAQDPARLGTPYEYLLRPAPADRRDLALDAIRDIIRLDPPASGFAIREGIAGILAAVGRTVTR